MRSAFRPRSFQARPLALTSPAEERSRGLCATAEGGLVCTSFPICCCPTASEAMHGLWSEIHTLLPIPRQAISILRPVERDGMFGNLAHR